MEWEQEEWPEPLQSCLKAKPALSGAAWVSRFTTPPSWTLAPEPGCCPCPRCQHSPLYFRVNKCMKE